MTQPLKKTPGPSSNSFGLNDILRSDLASFTAKAFETVEPGKRYLPNWHIRAITWKLEKVMRGETRRLLITMPPRSLKSICTSVAFPAFALGHDPTKRILCISYADRLVSKHARECRTVMASPWYGRVFPRTRLSKAKNTELEFETTRHGSRFSTTVQGPLTGFGGSLIILDDPQKSDDTGSATRRASVLDWFRNTLVSRQDNKREDAIVVVMQRLHVDDMAGYLIGRGGWEHLNLPAIATADEDIEIGDGLVHHRRAGDFLHPAREGEKELAEVRTDMGSFHFAAQYQQEPVPEEGNLIRWDWFERYSQPPAAERGSRIVQSWDLAVRGGSQNNYTVCITARVHGNTIHILDVFRRQLDFPDQKKAYGRLATKFGASVCLIEKAANAHALAADLKRGSEAGVPTPRLVNAKGDKEERLALASSRIEDGDVLLPEQAPWLDEFRTELLAFPRGRHDDQVDALSQLINWHQEQQRRKRTVSMSPPQIIPLDRTEW